MHMTDIGWDDLKLILAICRTGSLSGAARMLGVTHSTVFRRINAIEKNLDVRLFDRHAGGYSMTEAGEAVQRAAERIDAQVDDLTRELLGRDLRLQGRLRVTSPEGIALRILAPKLSSFCSEHPGIQMDLVMTSDALRLSRREADIAVRVTRKPPDNLIGRRICSFRFAMYATRRYMRENRHLAPEDHQWVVTDDGFDQLPPAFWKKKDRSEARIVFTSNNVIATVQAAKQHLGIAPLPCFLGDAESGLLRAFEPVDALTMDLWVLTHPDLRNTARVRVLMTYLIEALEAERPGFEGTGKTVSHQSP